LTKRLLESGMAIWRRIRVFLGFLLASTLLVWVVFAVAEGVDELIEDSRAVAQSHRVLQTVRSAYAEARDAESSQRGFLLTGSEDYLVEFYASQPAAMRILGELTELVANDASQSVEVREFSGLIQQRVQLLDQVAATRSQSGFDAALSQLLAARGAQLMEQIAQQAFEIETAERERLQRRSRRSEATAQSLRNFAAIGVAFSLLVLLVVFGLLLFENRARTRAQRAEVVARKRLEDNLISMQRASSELQELSRFGGMLQSCRSVFEAILLSRDSLARLLPGMGGSIYLIDAGAGQVRVEAQFGRPLAPTLAVMRASDCWALRRGQSYALALLNADSKCPHLSLPPSSRSASTLCIPLTAQGTSLGLITLSGSPGEEGLAGHDLARAAAEQLAACLFNLQLQESLRAQSIRDPLTGLYNRRYLEEALPREIARCTRSHKPLAVAMCDIDHFKQFNDTHGHDGGDAMLKAFAAMLLDGARREDIVCRFGGEEFTLILPEADEASSLRRLNQLRESAAALKVEHLGQVLGSITASFGLAMMPHDGDSAEGLLRAADAALYRAKASGRNSVVLTSS
jgi:diguanylate cyclase (GGDEF)-like protein